MISNDDANDDDAMISGQLCLLPSFWSPPHIFFPQSPIPLLLPPSPLSRRHSFFFLRSLPLVFSLFDFPLWCSESWRVFCFTPGKRWTCSCAIRRRCGWKRRHPTARRTGYSHYQATLRCQLIWHGGFFFFCSRAVLRPPRFQTTPAILRMCRWCG